jgi:hypothetical protein
MLTIVCCIVCNILAYMINTCNNVGGGGGLVLLSLFS